MLMHRSAMLMHWLAMLMYRSAMLMHRLAMLMHRSAMLMHRLAMLMHRSAMLMHWLAKINPPFFNLALSENLTFRNLSLRLPIPSSLRHKYSTGHDIKRARIMASTQPRHGLSDD